MAEVKWIKISTNIFDDEAIELIEQMPEGDAIIVIWFKLLTKAGKINDGGLLYFKEHIPYTDEMLATIFKKPINIVRMAIQVLEKFDMIEITSSDEILIKNWEKHQNLEKLEQIRDNTRARVARHRAKKREEVEQKLLECNAECNVTVTESNVQDIDKDIDKEEDKEIEINNITTEVNEFFKLYNSIAKRLPKAQKLSESRKAKIKARLKNADLKTWQEVFTKCEKSDFCCGVNNQNWTANIDWLISNDNNYVKVLEGKYDNKFSLRSNELSSLQSKGMDIL